MPFFLNRANCHKQINKCLTTYQGTFSVVMKNCEPLVPGPELAIESKPINGKKRNKCKLCYICIFELITKQDSMIIHDVEGNSDFFLDFTYHICGLLGKRYRMILNINIQPSQVNFSWRYKLFSSTFLLLWESWK